MAKRKYKKRQTKKNSLDFGVIITLIFSALLTVLIYAESGYVGIVLSDFFGGMFGVIKYVLAIGSFAVAVKMACKDDDDYLSSKIFQYTLLLIFIAVILSVYEIYNGVINIDQKNLKMFYAITNYLPQELPAHLLWAKQAFRYTE